VPQLLSKYPEKPFRAALGIDESVTKKLTSLPAIPPPDLFLFQTLSAWPGVSLLTPPPSSHGSGVGSHPSLTLVSE
jgi:hypothetical protein